MTGQFDLVFHFIFHLPDSLNSFAGAMPCENYFVGFFVQWWRMWQYPIANTFAKLVLEKKHYTERKQDLILQQFANQIYLKLHSMTSVVSRQEIFTHFSNCIAILRFMNTIIIYSRKLARLRTKAVTFSCYMHSWSSLTNVTLCHLCSSSVMLTKLYYSLLVHRYSLKCGALFCARNYVVTIILYPLPLFIDCHLQKWSIE